MSRKDLASSLERAFPVARPAKGHIPFPGHRTMAEVIEDENRREILASLGERKRRAQAA